MSATVTRKFWNGTQYNDISKVVFTSTNIDTPAAAGTRSHVLPGSSYIGTWYESVDFQYKQKNNQNPPNINECLFNQFFLYQDDFTFNTDSSVIVLSKYPITISGTNNILHYNRDNNSVVSSLTDQGLVTYSGISYNKYLLSLSTSNGTTTISGAYQYQNQDYPSISGSQHMPGSLYLWNYLTATSGVWAAPDNSIIFEVESGEIYNCRLTAWDDNSHSTNTNRILQEQKYKVTCCAYKSGNGTKQEPVTDGSNDLLVHPPGIDIPLSGNDCYFGDFDLVHVSNGGSSGLQGGEFLYFVPRLDDIDDSYSSGNYDFVTTLHYQYT